MRDPTPLLGFDLNLLPALSVLLEERNVTRAARRLGLSQSATSRALSRLREQLGDELLVRVGSRMLPTPRALSLLDELAAVLEGADRVLHPPPPFDPTTSDRTFAVGTVDYGQAVVLPRVQAKLDGLAPGVRIVSVPLGPDVGEDLASGRLDLALVPRRLASAGTVWRPLLRDHFVVLARRDHPRVGDTLDLDQYCAERHVLVSPEARAGDSQVDRVLRDQGRTRRVGLSVTSFLAAPILVSGSDLLTTSLSLLAEPLARGLDLRVLPVPFALDEVTVSLAWHERFRQDDGHRWLRELVVDAMHGLPR
jgi:DNA-binding transcriptional LysR family regulator